MEGKIWLIWQKGGDDLILFGKITENDGLQVIFWISIHKNVLKGLPFLEFSKQKPPGFTNGCRNKGWKKARKNYFKVLGIYFIPTSTNYLMCIEKMLAVSICLYSSAFNCNYTFVTQLLKMELRTALLLICMHCLFAKQICVLKLQSEIKWQASTQANNSILFTFCALLLHLIVNGSILSSNSFNLRLQFLGFYF